MKFGMVVITNKSKNSCSINNGCHGYDVTSFLSIKIKKYHLKLTSSIFGTKRIF